MEQAPAAGQPSHRRDRWAWMALAPSAALCLLLALTVFFGEFSERAVVVLGLAFPLLLLLGVCRFAYGSIAALVFLVTGRWRRAVSHLLAVGMLVLAVLSVPTLAEASRDFRFKFYLPTYEARIAEWRARNPNTTPVRLVLEDRDLSLFVTANHFEKIIYDESDGALEDPCAAEGKGRCPMVPRDSSESDGIPRSVHRIWGHFFRFDEY